MTYREARREAARRWATRDWSQRVQPGERWGLLRVARSPQVRDRFSVGYYVARSSTEGGAADRVEDVVLGTGPTWAAAFAAAARRELEDRAQEAR